MLFLKNFLNLLRNSKYNIMSIPTVIAFAGGEVKNKLVGLNSKQMYIDLVK